MNELCLSLCILASEYPATMCLIKYRHAQGAGGENVLFALFRLTQCQSACGTSHQHNRKKAMKGPITI